MGQLSEESRMAMEKSVMGGLEMIEPDKRPNPQELFQFVIDDFINSSQISEWDGYRFPPGFRTNTAQYAYDKFEPKEGDVMVASYGKTGTTWLSEIVRHLLYIKNKPQLELAKNLTQFYTYLEFGPVAKYQVLNNLQLPRRFLGTHLPASLVNLEKFRARNTKILYIMRNPKDQAVSWYHFATNFPFASSKELQHLFPKSEKDFYDVYLAGRQPVMSKEGEGYLEHVREWYEHRNNENVLFLVYEEMKQDIQQEIRKIAKFIDVELTDAELEEVVQRTSFKNMKNDSTKHGKAESSLKLFRKGQVGDWKNHLTVAQSELIDANVERILGDTDVTFIYH